MSFVIDLFALAMTTYLMRHAKLFDAPRSYLLQYGFFRNLLSCQICSGVWAAFFVHLAPEWLVYPLALAGVNYLLWELKTHMESADDYLTE
jgi:hypothetical protein